MKYLAAMCFLTWASVSYGADGDLDSGFQPSSSVVIHDIARQPDGKVIVAGLGGGLMRLNSNGSRDSSFTGSVNNTIRAIAVLPSGKILVGGSFTLANGVGRRHLARFNNDGTLDTGFVPPTLNGYVYCIAPLDNGQVLVAGGFGALIRLNADGSKDHTFSAVAYGDTLSLLVQPDGKILVGGAVFSSGSLSNNYLYRLNSNGSRDNSFIATLNNFVADIVLQADGKIVVGGEFTSVNSVSRARVARLDGTGVLDSSFDPGSGSSIAGGWVWSISIQADNRIVLGGLFTDYGGTAQDYLVRLNSNGTLDNGFSPAVDNWVLATLIQPDGKLLVGGEFTKINGTNVPHLSKLQASNLDTDNDGYSDLIDNCASVANATQVNTDSDAEGDACDADDDNDGMPDTWEIQYGLNPLVNDASGDLDGDRFTNLQEYQNGTDPTVKKRRKHCGGPSDFDRDGIADILWRNGNTKEMRSWTMDGSNLYTAISFFPQFSLDTDNWKVVGQGDIDADGDADIVWRNIASGYNRAWIMEKRPNGEEIKRETLTFYPRFGSYEWSVVGMGDANQDGTEDLFFHNSSNGQFRIWEMDRTGNRETVCFFVAQTPGYEPQAIDDFDGDGDADVFWRDSVTGINQLWRLQNCALAETVPLPSLVSATTDVVGSGDFNHDKVNDLLWINSANNSQRIWGMVNGKRGTDNEILDIIPGDDCAGIADHNGDGTDDILYYNPTDGYPRLWWMNNFTRSSHVRTYKFGAGGSWNVINGGDD